MINNKQTPNDRRINDLIFEGNAFCMDTGFELLLYIVIYQYLNLKTQLSEHSMNLSIFSFTDPLIMELRGFCLCTMVE